MWGTGHDIAVVVVIVVILVALFFVGKFVWESIDMLTPGGNDNWEKAQDRCLRAHYSNQLRVIQFQRRERWTDEEFNDRLNEMMYGYQW